MCRQTGNLWFILIQKGREKKDGGAAFEAKWRFLRPNLFFFFEKVWLFQIKGVPLRHENPPSLFTMLKSAGRFVLLWHIIQRHTHHQLNWWHCFNLTSREIGNPFWMTDPTCFYDINIFTKTKQLIDAELAKSRVLGSQFQSTKRKPISVSASSSISWTLFLPITTRRQRLMPYSVPTRPLTSMRWASLVVGRANRYGNRHDYTRRARMENSTSSPDLVENTPPK